MQQRSEQQFLSVTDKEAGNRDVTVIGGLPFYQSTGTSSGEGHTWFPFMGLNPVQMYGAPKGAFIKPPAPALVNSFPDKLADYLLKTPQLAHIYPRFGNYEAMCLSMLIGGGFWKRPLGAELKNVVIQNYPNEIAILLKSHRNTIKQIQNRNGEKVEFSARNETSDINQWLIKQGSVADVEKDFSIDFNYKNFKTKPIAKTEQNNRPVENSVFTRIANFFTTPSLARNIILGAVIGVLLAGAVAAALVLLAGTAGLAPLTIGAIGLGIVGLTTAVSVVAGDYFQGSTNEKTVPQTEKFKDKMADLNIAPKNTHQKTVIPEVKKDIETPAIGIIGKSEELLRQLKPHEKELFIFEAMNYLEQIIAFEKKGDKVNVDAKIKQIEHLSEDVHKDLKPLLSKYVDDIRKDIKKDIQDESKSAFSSSMR